MRLKTSTFFAHQIFAPTPIITVLSPRKDANQVVILDEINISPIVKQNSYIDNFGNSCTRMLFEPGRVEIKAESIVDVNPENVLNLAAKYIPVNDLPSDLIQFLLPSRFCLSDTDYIRNFAFEIIRNIEIGYLQVLAISNWIHQNVTYQYGFTYNTTHSNDILNNRVGVCRDFAHLAISMCRSINIPARMAVGFLKDLPTSDLHAWFEAYVGNEWYVFDAVQKETTGGRITLAYGRDANDVAFITQFGTPMLLEMTVIVEEVYNDL